jgi:hypothetical protein
MHSAMHEFVILHQNPATDAVLVDAGQVFALMYVFASSDDGSNTCVAKLIAHCVCFGDMVTPIS